MTAQEDSFQKMFRLADEIDQINEKLAPLLEQERQLYRDMQCLLDKAEAITKGAES